jgi:tRNA dimethylallyltransferase
MPQKKVLILFGPTASGKSNLALKVSSNIDATIINADSLQIYKNLRILTSRPTVEDEKKVAHKLYGVMDGVDNCSVAYWLELVKKEIQKCWDRNKLPIVVGGTGMYLKALMEGISEIPSIPNSIKLETEEILKKNNLDYLYNEIFKVNQETRINKQDRQRIVRAFNVLKSTGKTIEEWQKTNKRIFEEVNFERYLPQREREDLYKISEKRFDEMLRQGAIQEVKKLLEHDFNSKNSIMKAIGVREIQRYLRNEISKEKCIDLSKKNTRNYIKRQLTWIRGNNISSNIDIKKYI